LGVPLRMGEVWVSLLRTKEPASVQGSNGEAHFGVPVFMGDGGGRWHSIFLRRWDVPSLKVKTARERSS
jgi:hypothetical protein